MRAVVVDESGRPRLAEVAEPEGEGSLVRVLACGLCGSDVEKLTPEHAGTVLGHEIVAVAADGTRVVLLHHRPCGRCERCRAGHESTCDAFAAPTIRPGGFAARVRALETVGVASQVPDAVATYAEPLACVLRGAARVPAGRVLVVGHGFVGRLWTQVLRRRGDEVFALDVRPERSGPTPDGPVDAVVLCAPGGAATALEHVEPGGTILVFADAGALPLDPVYRRELHVVGSRSATPRSLADAVALLTELDLPAPTVLPLDRFDEGLELYRSGAALKVVFTP